jgi:pyridoxamine 5'-phosphate oxidase
MLDPIALLKNDRARARDARDPWANLCVLATVDADHNPQARVVVLRDVEHRFAVFVNGTSPKCTELQRSQHQSVLLYLASLAVQYRLRVTLESVPTAIVHASWLERPRIPKVMDWLYEQVQPQSAPLDSRQHLMDHYAHVDEGLAENATAPPNAIGYYLTIDRIDRLELSGDRPHSRTLFRQIASAWHATTLVP